MADQGKTGVERTPEFKELYANNVRFESSVWDLKLLFGTLDQSVDPSFVRQNSSVALPWVQAKIMLHFLYANVLFQEAINGTISVPTGLRPAPMTPFTEGELKDDPKAQAVIDRVNKLAADLFG
jgi:hypothetical protein